MEYNVSMPNDFDKKHQHVTFGDLGKSFVFFHKMVIIKIFNSREICKYSDISAQYKRDGKK